MTRRTIKGIRTRAARVKRVRKFDKNRKRSHVQAASSSEITFRHANNDNMSYLPRRVLRKHKQYNDNSGSLTVLDLSDNGNLGFSSSNINHQNGDRDDLIFMTEAIMLSRENSKEASSADMSMSFPFEHLFSKDSADENGPSDVPTTPSYDAPSAPSVNTPSFGSPSAPIIESPSSPSVGSPSAPSLNPPSLNAPSTPSIESPSISAPSDPSIESPSAPSSPSVGYPSAPSINAPSAPSAPSIGFPSAPSIDAPSAPSIGFPSAPVIESPSAPSGGFPSVPSINTPSAPSIETTLAPAIGSPSAPSIGVPSAPSAPSNNFPSEPSTSAPAAPSNNSPSAPSINTPSAPSANFPTITTETPTLFFPGAPSLPTAGTRPPTLPAETLSPVVSPITSPSLSQRPTFNEGSLTATPTFSGDITTANPTFPSESTTATPTFAGGSITATPTLAPNAAFPTMPSITSAPTVVDPSIPAPPIVSPPTTATDSPIGTAPPLDQCTSDDNGNYGFPTAPAASVVRYRYQTEVSSQTTVRDLNNDILKQMEKAISDLLIPNLFVECGGASPGISQSRIRPDILHIEITGTAYGTSAEAEQKKRGANEGISVDGAVPGISEEGRKAAQQRALPFFQGSSGTSRTQNLGGSAQRKSHGMHRRSLLHGNKNGRFLQGGNLVGLRVTPPDVVLLGAFQNACPSPEGGNGADGEPLVCYVIVGGLSVFGSGDLSWVDAVVQDSLKESMNAGEFDNGEIDSSLEFVRYIPPDTILNITDDESNLNAADKSGDGTPAWAWVLVAIGILGLLLCVVYLVLKRKKQQEELDRVPQETEALAGDVGRKDDSDGEEDKYSDDENSGEAASDPAEDEGYSNSGGHEGNNAVHDEGSDDTDNV